MSVEQLAHAMLVLWVVKLYMTINAFVDIVKLSVIGECVCHSAVDLAKSR